MKENIRFHLKQDGRLVIRGRELYAALEVAVPYQVWFTRICRYGFQEGRDYSPVPGSVMMDELNHDMTLGMAREICLIEQSEIGRKCRE